MIDISWKQEWFPNLPQYNQMHWEKESNQRDFLEKIAVNYGLHTPNDWRKVTVSLIRTKGGTVLSTQTLLIRKGLLARYGYSLYTTLSSLYPNTNWISVKSQSQVLLEDRISSTFIGSPNARESVRFNKFH